MKKHLYISVLIISGIALGGSIYALIDNTAPDISEDTLHSFKAIGITKLSFEFKGADIILKATTNTDMTCEALIEQLAINDVVVDNKIYTPSCNRKGATIVITYKRSM